MSAGLAAHMEAVARRLLGEPNKHLSTKTELRFGTNGSMSIDIKKGTWFSHEDDKGGGVLDLIHRELGLANGAAVEWMGDELGIQLEDEPRQQDQAKPRIVARYGYTSETGTLLFEVVRFEPKDFRQRRPNGKGGWIWSVKGIELVPYRLPELLNAEEVFVVEGEKDVDRLASLGIVATCNPRGAGKWLESFGK